MIRSWLASVRFKHWRVALAAAQARVNDLYGLVRTARAVASRSTGGHSRTARFNLWMINW